MKIKNILITQILDNLDNLQAIEPKVDYKDMRLPLYNHLVMLVDVGFIEYTKMTTENYYYWWYEVDISKKIKPNKRIFTADVSDFKITTKGYVIKILKSLDYYKDNDYYSYYNIMNKYDYLYYTSHFARMIEYYVNTNGHLDATGLLVKHVEYLSVLKNAMIESAYNNLINQPDELIEIFKYKNDKLPKCQTVINKKTHVKKIKYNKSVNMLFNL